MKTKQDKRKLRHKRVRAKIFGTSARPRVCVYKSNTQIIAQAIDDTTSNTLFAVSSLKQKGKTKKERAIAAARELAEKMKKAGIEKLVFDRGGFAYVSTIKEFADTLREEGLQF